MADDKTTKTPEQPVTDSGPGKEMSVNDHVLEYWLPTWKIPSAKMRRMGMASCTLRGIRNFSRSIFCAFDRVLIKRYPRFSS